MTLNPRVQESTLEYIKIVKSHEEIYNTTHPGYKNLERKALAWKKVSQEVGLPIDTCKRKWKNLRDSYTKYLRSFRVGSKTSRKYQYWAHAHHMDFLKPYQGSSRTPSNNLYDDDDDNQMPKDEVDCDLGYAVLDKVSSTNEPITLDDSTDSIPIITNEDFHNNITESIYHQHNTPQPQTDSTAQKKQQNLVFSPKSISFSKGFVKDGVKPFGKKKDDSNEKFHGIIKTNKDTDSLSLFFLSLAKSVEKMPRHKQSLAKMKCMKIITDMEIDILQTNCNESSMQQNSLEQFTYVMSPSKIEISISDGEIE